MKNPFLKRPWLAAVFAALALLTVPMWASATPMHYTANLTTLNDSGVTGTADLTLDGDMLNVHIAATGLAAGKSHPQHIHGQLDSSGNPIKSTTPTLAQDVNGDGTIELGEGATTYGPILIPLTNANGSFPTAPDGTIDFTQAYDLGNSDTFNANYSEDDVLPLSLREIVLHGLTTPVDITDNLLGQSYKAGDYDPVLPVASGEIVATAVPGPGSLLMMITGLGLLLTFVGWRRIHY